MKESLKKRCELFIQNRDYIKREISWQNGMLYPICANIYVQKNEMINCDRIKECRKIIKRDTGVFSEFRGIANLVIAKLLSIQENPEQKFQDAQAIYKKLREEFHASQYLPLTAVILATMQNENYSMDSIIKKAKAIYKGVKSDHPMITSSEDPKLKCHVQLPSIIT